MTKVEDKKENVGICRQYCTVCPSYPGEGILFCARGKSSKAVEKQGCYCPSCEVQTEYGCTGTYYCIEGACE